MTAAILAGGAGSRFGGQDKGLVDLCGRPLVHWVTQALRPQCQALLIVANRNLDRYAELGPVVADAQAGFPGPLEGIRAALGAVLTPWMLTVPVDCPRPGSDLASRLASAVVPGCAGTVAFDGVRRQPLFALYHVPALRAAALPAQSGSVWQWQDALGIREVSFADTPGRFHNLNTLEELRAFAASAATGSAPAGDQPLGGGNR
ncbi:molybdenum cofactor guanylyltransferase MobA [Tahibacter amnicola]|uniref:Molybdenum cofactor guanylyltransferase n=1 Tax=Tahibacter amnicola TaxID=2976241 RepID=A0ABY6B9Z2_9GAMM|nr:molybdenum cofactor guanylyltransferase MobA [Tahibacter amnicola]UXI66602.1 molybdenum cofactor guanylyltransferase [Tahibacter amnicola]